MQESIHQDEGLSYFAEIILPFWYFEANIKEELHKKNV